MKEEFEQRLGKLLCAFGLDSVSEPQRWLYHYTSAEAGMSILDEKKIWFRNAGLMNDYKELEQGRELMERWIGQTSDINGDEKKSLENAFQRECEKWKDNAYLLCFIEGDEKLEKEPKRGKLSMWRGYGTGGGVAFAFDLDGVISVPIVGSPIYPVQYWKRNKFNSGMKHIVEAARQKYQKEAPGKWKDFLENVLPKLIYLIKHPGFREEREWRIVLHPDAALFGKFKVRRKVRGNLETVLELPLDLPGCSEEERCRNHVQCFRHLKRVIVGPSGRAPYTEKMFQDVLKEKGVVGVDTVISDTPYRPA